MIEEQYWDLLNYGKGRLHPDMQMVILCKEMNWTYEEYLRQPDWFLDLLVLKMNLDSEYEKKEIRKAEQKAKIRGKHA